MSLINTQYWKEEALRFIKDGTYCRFPKGSYQYREYWEEQTKRCMEGYSVGGVHVPGTYYYYLNFYPILGKDEKTNKKTRIFPRVTDVDFEFFTQVEIAKQEGKGFILVKPRRTGFSFKNSCLLSHEYNFYRDAQCWIGAYQKDLAETTFGMTLQGLNFLNENTAWKKNRDPDTKEYVKARVKIKTDEGDIWKGYNSSIGRLTFMDNPFAAIGKSANIFIFEEAGRWPGLIQSYNITEPCWRDGADMIGTPIIFGCVCAGTKVWTNDGREINIENLHQDEGIIGYGGRGVLKQPIIWKKPIAAKPCYRITLSNNKTLECSHDHPLLWSKRGYLKYNLDNTRKKVTFKKAEEIKVGDQLMWARQVPVFGKEKMWNPRLVGLLIGDGYYGTGAVELCTGDKEIYEWLVKSELIINVKKEFETKDLKWFTSVNINSCTSYLKDLGIFGQSKERKHLPEDIHKYDLYSIKELLGGYFDADGNVYYNEKKNAIRIVLTSKHKHLLEETAHLLYKLGISCSIRKETRKGGYSSEDTEIYRLYISKEEDVRQFKKHITFLTNHKQETLDKYIFKNTSRHVYNNCHFELNSDNNKGTYFLKDNQLDNLESLYVKKVEFIGNQIVYNLNAGISHTYITNGFVSGNTGGDMEGGTEEFNEMFYNPEKYNLKAFDNIWDDEVTSAKSGWFFPAYKMRFGTYKDPYGEHPEWKNLEMVDKNGNSLIEIAKQDILDFRKIKEQGVDQKAKQDAITQYPFTPKEAFLSNTVSRFPVGHLKSIKAKLDDTELSKHQIGKLVFKDQKIVFEDSQTEVPYREYPVKTPREGCIEMYEVPNSGDDGSFNIKRYIAGIDPYNYDVSKSESIGSIIVYDRITQRIAAEYSGKPDKTEKFYEICRRLLMYYEATAMYEANITGLYHYFEKKKCLYLLEDTPTNLRDRNVWRPGTNTSKGLIATKQVNDKGLEFIENWLKNPISSESEELNMDRIRSIGLLEELIKWEPDPRKNYDRISAFSMVMWFDQTLTEYSEQEKAAKNTRSKFGNYFNKFKKNPLENPYDKFFTIEQN